MKDRLKEICADIDAALAAVAAKHNLSSLKCSPGNYTTSSFMIKLEGVAQGGKSLEGQRYEQNAKMMGLPPLGTVFQSGGKTYRTTGMNTTGGKIFVERIPDNKEFLMDTRVAVRDGAGTALPKVG